ncbi:TIGR04141 family sporadically distributed protein [Sinomonas flava]|uniref:TIGR04141 family sporadically distributed protein n=1 Tax=Sinomonas flava TaxID=496857 RepID=A0ABN3BJH9_9MICC
MCFGYGAGVLEWDRIEANFGLRVAARKFDHEAVTELRSRRIDASARTQLVQIPSGTELRDLGVQLDGEFVRRMAGRIAASDGSGLSGPIAASDSIAFRSQTDLAHVQQVLRQLLTDIETTAAQDEFEFIDSLEPLRESEQETKDLNDSLAKSILDPQETGTPYLLEFAPPDDVQIDEVEEIIATRGDKSETLEEYTVHGLRKALQTLGVRRGTNFLTNVRLMAKGPEGEPKSMMLPLKQWVIFESGHEDFRFVLTIGRWFRLKEAYTQKLNLDLAGIHDVTALLNLPPSYLGEPEGSYNERAAAGTPNLLLMDKVNIQTTDGNRFEACDLLHCDGYLVHVKRYTGSQTLSHLFSQGAVSAELLNEDAVAREDFSNQVLQRNDGREISWESSPRSVTYAIISPTGRTIPADLPTFSKVNLRDFARRLRRMSFEPSIAAIPLVAEV